MHTKEPHRGRSEYRRRRALVRDRQTASVPFTGPARQMNGSPRSGYSPILSPANRGCQWASESTSLSENYGGSRFERRGARCEAPRRRRCRCTSSRVMEYGNKRDGPAPPEPSGRMGAAGDLCVARRRRWASTLPSASRLELASQAPCARPLAILGQAPGVRRSDCRRRAR